MDEPWFTYERGPGRRRLSPRNAKGALVLIGFVLILVAIPMVPLLMGANPLIGLALMPVAFILFVPLFKFARSRSIMVEPVSSEELREFREWKRRGGGR